MVTLQTKWGTQGATDSTRINPTVLLLRHPKAVNLVTGCAPHAATSSFLDELSAGSATLPAPQNPTARELGVERVDKIQDGRLQLQEGGHPLGVTDQRGPRPVRMEGSGLLSAFRRREDKEGWVWEEEPWGEGLVIGLVRSALIFNSHEIRSAVNATLTGHQEEVSSRLVQAKHHIRGRETGCAHSAGICSSHATPIADSATPKNRKGLVIARVIGVVHLAATCSSLSAILAASVVSISRVVMVESVAQTMKTRASELQRMRAFHNQRTAPTK